jgi:hypothetical protein
MKLSSEIIVTADHLKLLKRAYVGWESSEFGAPGMDSKRPYGNSDVIGDIGEILEWVKEDDDEWSFRQIEAANKIHRDMESVLQILIVYADKGIKTGRYRMRDKYFVHSWEFVGP